MFAATILTGVLQVPWGMLKIARFIKFIPRAVIMGFVNALAILIFSAQIQYIFRMSVMTYILVLATLAIVYLFPYVF
ncbi:MAG TPA: hypothetical protein K8V56_20000 [Sporosarcina psychrophila]|uniref:SLC26A/SulP transporter domain-containing protein n=1 Tax=Sporosarcina psychrophila TaxID=1476 RepID=A0A921G5D0_SPOPS|nr:hypothetical protein [Sporosarcina psychrophila]